MLNDLIGVKYTEHGRTKEEGFDCYGLCIEVLKRQGIVLQDFLYNDMSEESKQQVYNSAINKIKNIKLKFPEKWCIVLLTVHGEPTHAGVYIGNGQFIHCMRDSGVVIDKLTRWGNRTQGYYKII